MSALLALATVASVCSMTSEPIVAAHRGGLDSAFTENTLLAFRHSLELGVSVIELDLRATADGQIVVLHDRGVRRTTDGVGLVHELTLSEVRSLDAGAGSRVPTFAEVLEWAQSTEVELLLDLKPAPLLDLQAVVAAVMGFGLEKRVLFGIRSLQSYRTIDDEASGLKFLGFVANINSIDDFVSAGVENIRVWPGWLQRDASLVEYIRSSGVGVWVTAGDTSSAQLRSYIELGVTGLIVDNPAEVIAELGCR